MSPLKNNYCDSFDFGCWKERTDAYVQLSDDHCCNCRKRTMGTILHDRPISFINFSNRIWLFRNKLLVIDEKGKFAISKLDKLLALGRQIFSTKENFRQSVVASTNRRRGISTRILARMVQGWRLKGSGPYYMSHGRFVPDRQSGLEDLIHDHPFDNTTICVA